MMARDSSRKMIRPDRAWPEMPPAGDPRGQHAERSEQAPFLTDDRVDEVGMGFGQVQQFLFSLHQT
jgi:hypothetical protein